MDPQTSVQPDQPEQPAFGKPDKPTKKIPVLYRIYGLYCFVSAAIVLGLIITITVLSATKAIDLTAGSNNASLTFILTVIQFVLMGVESVAMIVFGVSLLRNRRRHAAQMAYALIAINIISTLIEIMLHGFGENLIGAGVQLAILTIISVTVDPTLREERRRERVGGLTAAHGGARPDGGAGMLSPQAQVLREPCRQSALAGACQRALVVRDAEIARLRLAVPHQYQRLAHGVLPSSRARLGFSLAAGPRMRAIEGDILHSIGLCGFAFGVRMPSICSQGRVPLPASAWCAFPVQTLCAASEPWGDVLP